MKLFVTGTDTNVGKTFVTTAIARRATAAGQRVFAWKPIETGSTDDQTALCASAGGWQLGPLRNLYTFTRPASPYAASTCPIDLDLIVATAAQPADVILVEGAGGWRVPLTETADISHLAVRLGFPALVVARATLGTINHSLLTVEAIERTQVPVAALILSQRPEDDTDFAAESLQQIQSRWPGVAFLFTGDPTELDPLFHVKQ